MKIFDVKTLISNIGYSYPTFREFIIQYPILQKGYSEIKIVIQIKNSLLVSSINRDRITRNLIDVDKNIYQEVKKKLQEFS